MTCPPCNHDCEQGSIKNNGGPAFPTETSHQTGNSTFHEEGMSLRDYFAAKAMPLAVNLDAGYRGDHKSIDAAYVAALAYEIADAMLEARK